MNCCGHASRTRMAYKESLYIILAVVPMTVAQDVALHGLIVDCSKCRRRVMLVLGSCDRSRLQTLTGIVSRGLPTVGGYSKYNKP